MAPRTAKARSGKRTYPGRDDLAQAGEDDQGQGRQDRAIQARKGSSGMRGAAFFAGAAALASAARFCSAVFISRVSRATRSTAWRSTLRVMISRVSSEPKSVMPE